MNCPNCEAELVFDEYFDDDSEITDTTIVRMFYYTCPNCNKQYIETVMYAMIKQQIDELD